MPKIHSISIGGGSAAMVFIHCALASAKSLLPLSEFFASDHKITLFDLPCHGRSDSLAAEVNAHKYLADFAANLASGPAHLVGHSLGGTLALRAAVEHPDRVSRLTLIEPVYFLAAEGTQAYIDHCQQFEEIEQAVDAGDAPLAAGRFMALWGGGGSFSALPKHQQQAVLRALPLVQSTGEAIRTDPDGVLAPGRLEAVRCPVTIITASQSPAVIGVIAEKLAGRMPNAARITVEGAGHMVPITHPALVAETMKNAQLRGAS